MSALRALRQLTASSSRVVAARQLSTVSRKIVPSLATRVVSTNARAFSVSARRFGEGATDVAVCQKLAEELKYEEETAAEVPETPGFLTQFLKTTSWETTGPGCLNVDMVAQEGHFVVENVSFYQDAKLGTELTAEADWKRRGIYLGPQFETLDVGVQEEIEKYLAERGVNEVTALFIPEYAEWKEQKEYISWLKNLKAFVEL